MYLIFLVLFILVILVAIKVSGGYTHTSFDSSCRKKWVVTKEQKDGRLIYRKDFRCDNKPSIIFYEISISENDMNISWDSLTYPLMIQFVRAKDIIKVSGNVNYFKKLQQTGEFDTHASLNPINELFNNLKIDYPEKVYISDFYKGFLKLYNIDYFAESREYSEKYGTRRQDIYTGNNQDKFWEIDIGDAFSTKNAIGVNCHISNKSKYITIPNTNSFWTKRENRITEFTKYVEKELYPVMSESAKNKIKTVLDNLYSRRSI